MTPSLQRALSLASQYVRARAEGGPVAPQPPLTPDVEGNQAVAGQAPGAHDDFMLNVDRGERATGRAVLTPAERDNLTDVAGAHGLPYEQVEQAYRRAKARYPRKAGWAPFTVAGVERNVDKSIKTDDDGLPALKLQEQSYQFHLPKGQEGGRADPKNWDQKHLNMIASRIVREVKAVADRNDRGDKNAKVIMGARNWYRTMRDRLRQEYGGFADVMGDVLGTTSAQTGVRQNWDNTIEVLSEFSRGKYDRALSQLDKFLQAGGEMGSAGTRNGDGYINRHLADLKAALPQAMEQAKAEGINNPRTLEKRAKEIAFQIAQQGEYPLITKADGKTLFNANSPATMMALLDEFRKRKPGDAPKTPNYTGNLVGYSDAATIDVWAARFLRRLAGRDRLPPPAESGVGGAYLASPLPSGVQTGGEFGFGQEAFRRAAKELRKDPRFAGLGDDDLQAIAWFLEKEIWTKNNWTSKSGEGGSLEQEANYAGVSDRDRLKELRHMAEVDSTAAERRKLAAERDDPKMLQALDKARADLDQHGWILDHATPAKRRDAYMDRMGVVDRGEAAQGAQDAYTAAKEAQKTIAAYDRRGERIGALEASQRERQQQGLSGLEDVRAIARRFVGGLSPDREEDPARPEHFEQGQNEVTSLIRSDPNVMMAKATPSRGRSITPGGDVYDEKAYDAEFVTRRDYDPQPLWQKLVGMAKERNQDSVFLSEVLEPGKHDVADANPGVEVYFRNRIDDATAEKITHLISALGVDAGFTFVTDFRAQDRASKGQNRGEYVGLRLQYIPEFGGGPEGVEAARDAMANAIGEIAKMDGVSNARYVEYDTQVAFRDDYEKHLAGHVPEGRSAAWRGQRRGASSQEPDRRAVGVEGQERGPPLLGRGGTPGPRGQARTQEGPVTGSAHPALSIPGVHIRFETHGAPVFRGGRNG